MLLIDYMKSKLLLVRNDFPRYIILLIWILINLILFLAMFFYYQEALKFFYLRSIVKSGLSFSRASAFCINFNSVLLILAVCKNLISITRPYLCCQTKIVRVIDKHITYHRYFGYMIIFFSTVHTLGHIYNFEAFVAAFKQYESIKPTNLNKTSEKDLLAGLVSTLSLLPTTPNGTYINPVRTENALPILEAFKLLPGITGILLCFSLCILASTSSEYIRRSFYNLFWYSHQLFALLFFINLIVHGLQGVVRGQTNLTANNPAKCYQVYWDWSSTSRVCDLPQFAGSMATSWIWILAPVLIYMFEKLTRFVRGLVDYELSEYVLHTSNVLELRIKNADKSSIDYSAGQYIYLNVKELAYFEWHPFTITSAPDDPYLSLHIRCEGDWTSELRKMIQNENNDTKKPNIKTIHVDGPYGTCAEDVFKYETVVLIGAGIGVTPYASILKHIWHTIKKKPTASGPLKKVFFFWICPSLDTFEWFGVQLKDLEMEMRDKHMSDLLDYRIYLTRGWSLREAKQIASNSEETYDLFTGLKQKTHYGRPNFELFFKEQSTVQANNESSECKHVGIFYCGPSSLSTQIHKLSNKYSNDTIRFFYNKESF